MHLGHASAHVDLALDLLAGPASGLDGARAILPGRAGFTDQSSDPVVAEIGGKLAVGEGISEVTS